jgi:hypothetical protein
VGTTQPAGTRWEGLAASIHPQVVASADWADLDDGLDRAAAASLGVSGVLPALAASGPLPEERPGRAVLNRLHAESPPPAAAAAAPAAASARPTSSADPPGPGYPPPGMPPPTSAAARR